MTWNHDLENIRERVLALRRAGWKALAEKSGVPFSTIRKFAYGEVQEPGYNTVRAMLENLDACEPGSRPAVTAALPVSDPAQALAEEGAA